MQRIGVAHGYDTIAAEPACSFDRPTRSVIVWRVIAFILACVAALIVAVCGPLHRYLGLDIEAAIAVFRYGFYVAVAGDRAGACDHRADAARATGGAASWRRCSPS